MLRGEVYINPASGERVVVRVGSVETGGERLVVDLHLRPGGGMTGRHYHPAMVEQFRVLHGQIRFSLNGVEQVALPGQTVEIPAGVVHDFWNTGSSEAVARVEVSPAGRFVELIKNGFGLAQDGKTDSKGRPGLLQVSLMAPEFADVIRYVAPPPVVQKVLFALLGPIARWKGLQGSYAEYFFRPAQGSVSEQELGEA